MAVSKRLRFEIFKRDGNRCKICGRTPPDVTLHVDHVVPVALGGSDEPTNLRALCSDCNGGKSSVPADAALVEDVAADAARWSRAMQAAGDQINAEEDVLAGICEAVERAWRPRYMPSDARGSIYAFVKAGLCQEELVDLVNVAFSARGVDDRWSYFCGCCWKRIKKMQERASAIIASGSDAPPTDAGPKYVEAPLTITGSPTMWTTEDLDAFYLEKLSYAEEWCRETDFEATACRHITSGGGHCADALCMVQYATSIHWIAQVRQQEYASRAAELEEIIRG
jgi:hypothetical protein